MSLYLGTQLISPNVNNIKSINNTPIAGTGNITVANSDLSNLTSGLSNTVCTTKPTNTTGTATTNVPAVVIKNYVNTSSHKWYRKWSDGFIEQWGYANVTYAGTDVNLPTSFSDSDYTAIAIAAVSGATTNTFATPKSASILTIASGFNSATKTFWYACGY